ncbi:EAL domain-containing protein [Aquincola sp. MAHUQ-54]|uniref:EAL domain-containing protein n=1 Tax=Aquincola agrisoli TaxID=3119538 RepID=A0AAW9QMF4_9BURK
MTPTDLRRYARAVLLGSGVPEQGSTSAELRAAQFAALSRLIPLMYFILVANAGVLVFTFHDRAPAVLTWLPAAVLAVLCLVRLAVWRRRRSAPVSAAAADRALKRTNLLAAGLAAALVTWSVQLFPFGDAYEQGHVAFFLAVTMISSMFCLIHAYPAPLLIAVFAGIPFMVFFGASGVDVLARTAIDVLLVTSAALVIIWIQNRDFVEMVNARAEASRREREQSRLLRMIEDMPSAVMTVDPESFRINYANRASQALFSKIGYLLPGSGGTLVGLSMDVFHADPAQQRRFLADPGQLPRTSRLHLGAEILELQAAAITDSRGDYIGPMVTWALITSRLRSDERIQQLAHYDSLTGLVNRHTFHERLGLALASARPRLAVLMIDLDGFKLVNDTLGHRVGDALLAKVAQRLQQRCAQEALAVARLGGDEFAVLVAADEAEAGERLAGELVAMLGAAYTLPHGREVRIGASAGVALSPQHGSDSDTLLARADIALYAAKAAGKGTARTFTAEMQSRVQQRVRLEARLRAALENLAGLFVFFQPICDIATGGVTAREALVRWHDGRRWISPADFVPVAEETGLIDQLGTFVLDTACRSAAGWQDGARVAVNVSARQLGKGTLVPAVEAALRGSGLPAGRLEVEVTETALLCHGAQAITELRRLRELGVRVALDDFGTGYSSLAHLRTFSFDKIKIDGSFVRDAVDRADCAAVVRAVAELGRRLGVVTVAEGIERPEHLACARDEGCAEVQGYFLGRPVPRDEDVPLIARLDAQPADARETGFSRLGALA